MSKSRKGSSTRAQIKESALAAQRRRVEKAELEVERIAEQRHNLEPKLPNLTFKRYRYDLASLESGSLTFEEMRSEYSRLRSVANKRLQRIGETEFRSSQVYKEHKQGYPKINELTEAQLAYELADVVKFLSAKRSGLNYLKAEKRHNIAVFKAMNERRRMYNIMAKEQVYKDFPEEIFTGEKYWDFVHFITEIADRVGNREWYERMLNLYGVLESRHIKWQDILQSSGSERDAGDVTDIVTAFDWWYENRQFLENPKPLLEAKTTATGKKSSYVPRGAKSFRKLIEEYGGR